MSLKSEITIAELSQEIQALQAELDKHCKADCEWKWDDVDDYWETGCGNAYCIIEGTPTENKMKFCPYCGGALIPTLPPEADKWLRN